MSRYTKPTVAHCNRCSGKTDHNILHKNINIEELCIEDDDTYNSTTTHSMIECRGCKSISMMVHHIDDLVDDLGSTKFYPPRVSRKQPVWLIRLVPELRSLMHEIYSALHADSRRLALMGARTAIDIYLSNTVGEKGNFTQKMKSLSDNGHLGKMDCETLSAALDAGNAAAHRGHSPSSQDLNHVMDIVENLLHKIVLNRAAKTLLANTPKRNSAKNP